MPSPLVVRQVTKHHLVKLRPHVHHFLKKASDIAQMTIYTAGAAADNIYNHRSQTTSSH